MVSLKSNRHNLLCDLSTVSVQLIVTICKGNGGKTVVDRKTDKETSISDFSKLAENAARASCLRSSIRSAASVIRRSRQSVQQLQQSLDLESFFLNRCIGRGSWLRPQTVVDLARSTQSTINDTCFLCSVGLSAFRLLLNSFGFWKAMQNADDRQKTSKSEIYLHSTLQNPKTCTTFYSWSCSSFLYASCVIRHPKSERLLAVDFRFAFPTASKNRRNIFLKF